MCHKRVLSVDVCVFVRERQMEESEGVREEKRRLETHREVLEEPCPHDVGGDLGEDASLFLPLFLFVRVVVVTGARRGHTVV